MSIGFSDVNNMWCDNVNEMYKNKEHNEKPK